MKLLTLSVLFLSLASGAAMAAPSMDLPTFADGGGYGDGHGGWGGGHGGGHGGH
jgi:hypothetical protein